MKKSKKVLMLLCMVAVMTVLTVCVVSAAEPAQYDMTADMTKGIGDIATQIFAVIGIIVPVVLTIVGAKIGITKAISIFKSLTGK